MSGHENGRRHREAALGTRDARAGAAEVARARGRVHDDLRPADRAPLYRRGRRGHRLRAATSATRASFPTRAASIPPATAASCGRCGSSPASARRRTPTARYKALLRGRRHRPERRVRSADADGPRSRSRAVARRSGEVRRQRHVARRHGDAVRRHPARRHHHVDDDQLAGGDDLRDVSGGRRAAGRRLDRRCRARFRTTSSRSSSPRRNTSSRRARRCGSSPTSSRSAPSEVPRWNTISVSGYHIREAGATALQELAFTLRDGIEYVQWGVDAGLDVDDVRAADVVLLQRPQRLLRGDRQVPRRAPDLGARRCATASAPRTSGRGSCASTARPPASRSPRSSRTTTSSAPRCRRCRRCSAAPTRCTPTRSTRRWRCRPRRRRRWRCGRSRSSRTRAASTDVVDPLGGSYFVETLTRDMEDGGARLLRSDRRDGRHGRGDRARLPAAGDRRERLPLPAGGRAQGEDHRRRQRLRRRTNEPPIEILYIDESAGGHAARQARAAASDARRRRACAARSTALQAGAPDTANLMPPILDAVRAYATLGEMCDALREVWGEYEEVPII